MHNSGMVCIKPARFTLYGHCTYTKEQIIHDMSTRKLIPENQRPHAICIRQRAGKGDLMVFEKVGRTG